MAQNGAIGPLVKLLQPGDPMVQASAAGALWNLAANEHNKFAIAQVCARACACAEEHVWCMARGVAEDASFGGSEFLTVVLPPSCRIPQTLGTGGRDPAACGDAVLGRARGAAIGSRCAAELVRQRLKQEDGGCGRRCGGSHDVAFGQGAARVQTRTTFARNCVVA